MGENKRETPLTSPSCRMTRRRSAVAVPKPSAMTGAAARAAGSSRLRERGGEKGEA